MIDFTKTQLLLQMFVLSCGFWSIGTTGDKLLFLIFVFLYPYLLYATYYIRG